MEHKELDAITKDIKELLKFTGQGIDMISKKHGVSQTILCHVYIEMFLDILGSVEDDLNK